MIMSSIPITYPDAVYVTRELPPLSSRGMWGIFRSPEDENNNMQVPDVIDSKRLYYSPNTHDGVNYLVSNTSMIKCILMAPKFIFFVLIIAFVVHFMYSADGKLISQVSSSRSAGVCNLWRCLRSVHSQYL